MGQGDLLRDSPLEDQSLRAATKQDRRPVGLHTEAVLRVLQWGPQSGCHGAGPSEGLRGSLCLFPSSPWQPQGPLGVWVHP